MNEPTSAAAVSCAGLAGTPCHLARGDSGSLHPGRDAHLLLSASLNPQTQGLLLTRAESSIDALIRPLPRFEAKDHFPAQGVVQMVENLPEKQESWVQSLGWEDPMEKEITIILVFLPGEFQGQRSLVGVAKS